MSFVNMQEELAGRQDEHAVEEGEYNARIISVLIKEDIHLMIVRMALTEDPYAKSVTAMVNLAGSERDAREKNSNQNRFMQFLECFDIDPSRSYEPGNDQDDDVPGFCGREGWILLGPPTDDGKGYGEQNRIKKYIVGNDR